ncbi:hypothetical protein KC347_g9229 [Hortaea werneckii]|nr:hypothetical protein KC347_g9229 [Hortaea werneckii]
MYYTLPVQPVPNGDYRNYNHGNNSTSTSNSSTDPSSTRPRVTISIIAPNHDLDQDFISLDLPPGLSLADLKGFVNAETNVPQSSQQFYLNNLPIHGDEKTIEEAGIKDGDMLAMLMRQPDQQNNMGSTQRRQQQQQQQSQPPPSSSGQPQRRQMGPGQHEIETTRLSILGNPAAMAQVREQRPALAEAINDSNRFREVWMEMIREDQDRERERMEQMRLLNEDPFNVEAQAKIEEMIRQEQVQNNLQFAYEHNPEVFGRVTMLYIPVEVNRHPVKAFVDSGAQTTIMSPSCAESCNIMRLIDKRYSGVAKGVGTAQILGRVHSADIRIGAASMACSFTVMEGKDVDLLLGLDMLKRFQALIDLKNNKLVFGDGNEVSFLGESEIPKMLEERLEHEPTVTGPDGTEVGARSGTVKHHAGEGSSAAAAANGSASFQGAGRTLGNGGGGGSGSNAAAASHSGGAGATGAAPSSSTAGGARPAHSKENIDQLMALGFAREQAIAALDACDGNVEYAAGLLFQG